MYVQIEIVLTDLSDNSQIVTYVDNVDNRDCFKYEDNDGNICEMAVYNDGLCLNKQSKDHRLKLCLRSDSYAEISTSEGTIKLDAKVVDFNQNNDILVMRYIIEEIERKIEIIYRG